MKATTSTTHKGLAVAAKAVAVFLIALIATVTVGKYLFTYDNETDDGEDDGPSIASSDVQDRQHRTQREDRIAAWRDDVSESTSKDEKVERRRLQKKEKGKAEKKAKAEEKVRKMLVKEFWPKKNTLLGARKGEVVDVGSLEWDLTGYDVEGKMREVKDSGVEGNVWEV